MLLIKSTTLPEGLDLVNDVVMVSVGWLSGIVDDVAMVVLDLSVGLLEGLMLVVTEIDLSVMSTN